MRVAEPLAFSASFLAFCRSGVDLFLFNPKWGRQEEQVALRIARPHWALVDAEEGVEVVSVEDPGPESEGERPEPMRVMIATGGTTGSVRFAIHDWSTLTAATLGFQQFVNCDKAACHCVLPLYHVSGFMQLIRALLTGGAIVYGRVDAFEETHQLLLKSEPQGRFLSLVATQLERLMRNARHTSFLREYLAVFVGGGPVPASLLQRCRDLRIPLAPTYGMTETAAQVATLTPERFLRGESSLGSPLPHARIDIVPEQNPRATLPRGQAGLVRIACSSLFKGYYGEGAAAVISEFVTTDLGRFESDCSLSVFGRADRVIISGGEKIDLGEIERAVERSGLIRDVVAFGLKDSEWGEKLAVAYAPKEASLNEVALREAVAGELAGFKMPKLWKACGEIPRNEAGKPQIQKLIDETRPHAGQ